MEYLAYLIAMLAGAVVMYGYQLYKAKKAAPKKRKYVRKAKTPNAATSAATKPSNAGKVPSPAERTTTNIPG